MKTSNVPNEVLSNLNKDKDKIMMNNQNSNAQDMRNDCVIVKSETAKPKVNKEKLKLTPLEMTGIKIALSQHFLFNDKTTIIM